VIVPETTEFLRVPVTTAVLDGAAWELPRLLTWATELQFLRAVILDCRSVIRVERAGLDAIRTLHRALIGVAQVRLLVQPPVRDGFHAVWLTSGLGQQMPEPTPAQEARAFTVQPSAVGIDDSTDAVA